MQTAVDCNGSSSNTTTISTTIITTTTTTNERKNNDNNDDDTTTMTQHPPPLPPTTTTHHHSLTQQPRQQQQLTEAEATNILRHRVTNTIITTNNGAASAATAVAAASAPKNGLSHLIDASEYLGSNVECMTVTPSPSPQASPSKQVSNVKKYEKDEKEEESPTVSAIAATVTNIISTNTSNTSIITTATTTTATTIPSSFQDTYKTNTSSPESSSSKTASNSTSTTSSVIATPILRRNGNVLNEAKDENLINVQKEIVGETAAGDGAAVGHDEDEETGKVDMENVKDVIATATGDACKQFRECTNKQLLTNQMLPFENTSSIIIKKDLSSSSLPMSSSSTTSLSISAPATPIIPTASLSSLSSSIKPSPSSSSSASTATSVTPASAATTPALLSTTPSPSSSPSASSSSSSASSPSSPTVQSKMKELSISGLVEAELLQWQDMPQYLQFNPYVIKGYRPLQTFKGCLLSLFYWHNETINILTHAIPIVYILAIVPGLMPWDRGFRFLSFCHVFGSVAPWCGSFVYHLFMNIERGENVYYTLLKLDMVGIWVSQSFGALPLVTATTFCFTFKWKWFVIISYCLLSLWGLYKALTASSPWQRRLCFALPFTLRSILTFFRTIGLVGGNRVALEHVYLQDVVSILGGAIGAMRIPEKWFPGLVDFYLNSHNIMHVLVVVAVYSMHKATVKDFEWMDNTNCDAFVNVTSKVLESTLETNIEL